MTERDLEDIASACRALIQRLDAGEAVTLKDDLIPAIGIRWEAFVEEVVGVIGEKARAPLVVNAERPLVAQGESLVAAPVN